MNVAATEIMKHFKQLKYNTKEDAEAQKKLQKLLETIKHDEDHDIPKCIRKAKSLLEKNINLFHENCLHVDIITTLLEYLDYYADVKCNEKLFCYQKLDTVLCPSASETFIHEMIYILCYIYGGVEIFDIVTKSIRFFDSPIELHPQIWNVIIVFEDADLYAIMDSLKIYKLETLKKILVQEPLRNSFLSFKDTYFKETKLNINYFQYKSELLSEINKDDNLTTISIWSENVVVAKNLAMTIKNTRFFFINTYAVFGSNACISGSKLKCTPDHCLYHSEYDLNATKEEKEEEENKGKVIKTDGQSSEECIIHNLFYGGLWRVPNKNEYWQKVESHKQQIQWPDATESDLEECIKLAKEGFNTWSSYSIDHRIKIVEDFASKLSNCRKNLGDKILRWVRKSRVGLQNSVFYSKDGTTEIVTTRIPLGVIILTGEDTEFLLCQLILALISGNAVIVISGRDLCSIVEYCNIVSQCNFPPGVINSLSCYKPLLLLYYASTDAKKDIPLIMNNYNKQDLCKIEEESMILNVLLMKFTLPKCVLLGIK